MAFWATAILVLMWRYMHEGKNRYLFLTAIVLAFMFGTNVKGGQYSEFPSMAANDLEQGDVVPNYDFRGLYTTVLEDFMGLDAKPIVDGTFEKLPILA